MEEDITIHSSVYLGALNVALVLLTYAAVVAFGIFFVKWAHGIDIIGILNQTLDISIPFAADFLGLIEFFVEDVITTSLILALVAAAYMANYEVKVGEKELHFKRGFLFVKTHEFDIEDIEQVYTEDYTFFPKTKQLCIKALDEDVLKIPYVRNAEERKKSIIRMVKERHHELEVEESLEKPIRVMSWNPQ